MRRLLGDFGEEDPLVASEDSIGNLKLRRKRTFFTEAGSGVRVKEKKVC